ncbi:MAG: hypothetical protein E5Y74_00095 [Mesorhizobium sp.]|nr:MAG: hypothetical protein E5Y74_00095 [Mesorhizobium sp.]
MTEEQKQALIRFAKKISNTDRYIHANGDVSFFSESISMSSENAVALAYCALAALTAPPVKLPKKEKALIGRDYLYVYCAGPVESAIRAAGYQVEGE